MKVGGVLASVLDRKGLRSQIERATVVDEWPQRVGEAIARVTRARSVSAATLFVEVSSSAWLTELNMLRRELLERINEGRRDRIERIVFVLAETRPDGSQDPRPGGTAQPTTRD